MSKQPKLDVIEIASESAAHTVLNAILTQAAITKKSFKTKLKISYLELMKGIGDVDSNADVDLEVEIKCRWVESSLSEDEISIEEDETGGEAYD